jgi:hypothetical protein
MQKIARNSSLVLFAVLSGGRVVIDGFDEHAMLWDFWMSVPLLSASGLAIAFLWGVAWCRVPLRALAAMFLLLWSFLWAAQHAIDRTIGFWITWFIAEVLLVFVLISTRPLYSPLRRKPDKAHL